MMLSTRWTSGLVAAAALAAALQLGILHATRGHDPCASPASLKATALIPGATAGGQRHEELDEGIIQWSEGEVGHPVFEDAPMRFRIVRSYDAPALYGRPLDYAAVPGAARSQEGASEPRRLQPEQLSRVDVEAEMGTVPVVIAWDHTEAPAGPSRLVAWFFAFDNEPIRSPVASQLRNAFSLAMSGPRPLTLVTLSALAWEADTDRVEKAALAWLGGAWDYSARVCRRR